MLISYLYIVVFAFQFVAEAVRREHNLKLADVVLVPTLT